MFLGKCKIILVSLKVCYWNKKYRITTILSTWYFIYIFLKSTPRRKSKQLCYLILSAPPENWLCLPSPAPCILWTCRLVCKKYCAPCTKAWEMFKGIWFVLEGSVFTLNNSCWTVKMSYYFYHFKVGFFCMHFNGYLRVPVCLERNLNICTFKRKKTQKTSAHCRSFHQHHQMTRSCSWNNM